MANTLHILLVSPDPVAKAELHDALAGAMDVQAVLHFAGDHRQAVELARSHQPDFALIEMTLDLEDLRNLTEEIALVAPDTVAAGMFHPRLFEADVSESAFLIEAVRAGVRDFLRRPLSAGDLATVLSRPRRKAVPRQSTPGRVVSFVSNKGGVGKSTIATNVACGLAQEFPGRVLLIDASLQMGVCSVLLNLNPTTTLTDCVREWSRLDETLIQRLAVQHPCGLHLLACPTDAEEATQVDDEVMARTITLARRVYDFVIVDTFPMLDKVMLAALDLSDRFYVVVDNVVPTVLGAAKLIGLFNRLGFPASRLGIILNRYNSFGGLTVEDVQSKLQRPVDHVLPYEKKLVSSANLGEPYILGASLWRGFGKAVQDIVAAVRRLKPSKGPARPKTQPPSHAEVDA